MKKPWWNDTLTKLWNEVCEAERKWNRSHKDNKKNTRHIFVSKRKIFDKNCQQAKRNYWYQSQQELCQIQNKDPREFWKKIGNMGIGCERRKTIPMEVVQDDGSICTDSDVVLNKWKNSFENLLNCKGQENMPETHTNDNISDDFLDCDISIDEVLNVLMKAKLGKTPGIDYIPVELYRNNMLLHVLHKIFNKCFKFGKIPSLWGKGIITPIPKCSTSDVRDPLSYRGINLSPCSYKLYCSILNNRLVTWLESREVIHDEQNGFRRGRSTIDHLSTLTSIIETRKLKKLSTYAVFVDFKKAYDTVNRNLLFQDLNKIGISTHFLNTIKAIYSHVECAVKLNENMTNWLNVNSGLKQGCVLSPVLFNIFINSLVTEIKALDIGIDIDDEKIGILLYADDIVLVAENEADLQLLLDILDTWCKRKLLTVNLDKTKVVHFRNPSVKQTTKIFLLNGEEVCIVGKYQYLGLLLTEFLDYNEMAKAVAKSASRALSLLIVKSKAHGGFQHETFTKLFDTLVWSVISYGAAIWGTRNFACINAVQHRAIRFFMGVGKYTPNDAINGDMGWKPPCAKLWTCVFRHWSRCSKMSTDRLNFKIFQWCHRNAVNNKKNWCYKIMSKLKECNFEFYADFNNIIDRNILFQIENYIVNKYIENWSNRILSQDIGNKLRTYKLFKNEYGTEMYLNTNISHRYRSSFAKFRCGVAPLAIETGRYENKNINERICFICKDKIEDEKHVILQCPLYADLRNDLYIEASNCNTDFNILSDSEKFVYLFQNNDCYAKVAKTCFNILSRRNTFIYS